MATTITTTLTKTKRKEHKSFENSTNYQSVEYVFRSPFTLSTYSGDLYLTTQKLVQLPQPPTDVAINKSIHEPFRNHVDQFHTSYGRKRLWRLINCSMLNNTSRIKRRKTVAGSATHRRKNEPLLRSDRDGKRRCTWLVRYEEKERRLYNFSVDRHTAVTFPLSVFYSLPHDFL